MVLCREHLKEAAHPEEAMAELQAHMEQLITPLAEQRLAKFAGTKSSIPCAEKLLMSSKANIQFITPLIWDEYKVPLTCGPRPSLHGHVETCPSQIDSRA